MISLLLVGIGMIFFVNTLIKLMQQSYKKKWVTFLMGFIGSVLIAGGMSYGIYLNDQNEKRLLAVVATKLNVNSSEIIIENISEWELFGPSKNTNLRKVYYDNTTYLLELEGYSIKKIVKQSEAKND